MVLSTSQLLVIDGFVYYFSLWSGGDTEWGFCQHSGRFG